LSSLLQFECADVVIVVGVVIAASLPSAPVLDLRRWSCPVTDEEAALLAAVSAPVLDVGCGPGRFVEALRARGVSALGIDAALAAIAIARTRGVDVHAMSVFDDVPNAGSWATVLLLDGNIGIGADTTRLLTRVRELLRPGGQVVIELEPPGTVTHTGIVQFEVASGMIGWFPWCWVGIDDVERLAEQTKLTFESKEAHEGRWFAWLRRPRASRSS
jgi:SAM-dependent methyltransferase